MLHAERNEEGELMFFGGYGTINDTMSKVVIELDDPNQDCVAMKHWSSNNYITLFTTDCDSALNIMCRSWPTFPFNCSIDESDSKRRKRSVDGHLKRLDLLINPHRKQSTQKAIRAKTNFARDMFSEVRKEE